MFGLHYVCLLFSPIWGEGNGRGISRFAVNRGAVGISGFYCTIFITVIIVMLNHVIIN